jgi:hypothetical protein
MIVLERERYKQRFDSISLNYDAVTYEDDQFSHTYFQVGDIKIYVSDNEFESLEIQCDYLGIAVYVGS